MLPSINKTSESNPMSHSLYLYLSVSAFLISFTNVNKLLLNVKSVFRFLNHGFSL